MVFVNVNLHGTPLNLLPIWLSHESLSRCKPIYWLLHLLLHIVATTIKTINIWLSLMCADIYLLVVNIRREGRLLMMAVISWNFFNTLINLWIITLILIFIWLRASAAIQKTYCLLTVSSCLLHDHFECYNVYEYENTCCNYKVSLSRNTFNCLTTTSTICVISVVITRCRYVNVSAAIGIQRRTTITTSATAWRITTSASSSSTTTSTTAATSSTSSTFW